MSYTHFSYKVIHPTPPLYLHIHFYNSHAPKVYLKTKYGIIKSLNPLSLSLQTHVYFDKTKFIISPHFPTIQKQGSYRPPTFDGGEARQRLLLAGSNF
jgi:hypothetical protein